MFRFRPRPERPFRQRQQPELPQGFRHEAHIALQHDRVARLEAHPPQAVDDPAAAPADRQEIELMAIEQLVLRHRPPDQR
jgi:hypothetical protein